MPIKTLIVTTSLILSAVGKVNTAKGIISSIRQRIAQIRDTDLQRVWKSTENVDSNVFKQRMQEMDQDIQKMLDALEEYVQVLQTSATQFEAKQETVKSQAQALRSPRNR